MKRLRHIPSIGLSEVPVEVFEDICKLYPEGKETGRWFRSVLPADDPRSIAIIQRLKEAGYSPWTDKLRLPTSREFTTSIEFEYDPSDWEASEWLSPRPDVFWEHSTLGPDGLIELQHWEVDPDAPEEGIAKANDGLVVSSRIKNALETSGLGHIIFKPVAVIGDDESENRGRVPWDKFGFEPYWQIWSDYTLPPLSSACRFRDRDGKLVPHDQDCSINGFFLHTVADEEDVLRYRPEDMKKTEPFGLALTRERFGYGKDSCKPALIASHRLYQFCVEQKLKMYWVPVRIDPD